MKLSLLRFMLMGVLCLAVFSARAQVFLGNDTSYCDYDALELDAGPGFVSYFWSTGETSQTIDVLNSGLFWVEVVDNQSNVYRDSINILIYELPQPNFVGENKCLGDSTEVNNLTTFVNDSNITYTWIWGDGTSSTGFEPKHLYATPGVKNVTLAATNSTGCVDTFRSVLDVFDVPVVNAGADVSINVGDTAQLNGSLVVDSFFWTPPNFLSSDTVLDPFAFPGLTIEYVLNGIDILGCRGRDTMQVYVNQRPIAENDQVTTQMDQGIKVDVQGNDSDPNNDPLTTTIIDGPLHGTATMVGDSILYTPDANFNGRDTIIYQVCDIGTPPLCAVARLVIFVTNRAPEAVNDTATTDANTPVTVSLLDNDSDPNGQQIFISEIGVPAVGILTDQGSGVISYQPAEQFVGVDSFYYLLCDNGTPVLCDTGWVYIFVAAPDLEVPNSFSPNGDGQFDVFAIEGITNYPGNKLTIFTRWGDVILEQENYQNDWDGRRDFNEELPEGVYYYKLELANNRVYSGYIMLKR